MYKRQAVSFQIKELEKELNTALFERINHNIKLTPKGREILSLAHKMIAVSDEIKKAADDTSDAGVTIRIAMADSLCHFIFWNNFTDSDILLLQLSYICSTTRGLRFTYFLTEIIIVIM